MPSRALGRGTVYPEVFNPALIPLDTTHSLILDDFFHLQFIHTPPVLEGELPGILTRGYIFVAPFLLSFIFLSTIPPSLPSFLLSLFPPFLSLLDPQSVISIFFLSLLSFLSFYFLLLALYSCCP